jgi:serine/threonine-protein kinase
MLTTAGVALGTPAYMAPEQASADPHLDHRVDIYAVGAVAYELLTGRPVFMGTTPQMILSAHVTEAPQPVTKHRDTVPPVLEQLVLRCLEKKPADRFQSAEELLPQLEALATPSGGMTPTDTLPVLAVGKRSRWPVFVGAAVALIAVAVAVWALALRAPATDSGAIPLDTTAIAVLPFRVVGADSVSPSRDLARSMGDLFELKVTGEFGRRIAHPPSVVEQWRRAGGTPDTPLAEQAELEVARALGVGALVRGTVVESDNGITLAASIVDAVSGELRVPTVQVNGTVEQRLDLVDQLIVLLLARDAGYSLQDAPRLRHHRPEAIQALLAGNRAPYASAEQRRYYRAALAADSSLVDAALLLYANGENRRDTAELRYAWEKQELLPERLRAYLQVLAAGQHGTIRTAAQRIAGYEALATRWPEWQVMWQELGGELTADGALASIPDWRMRARIALDRVEQPGFYPLAWLIVLSFLEDDTVRTRALIDSFAATAEAAAWRRYVLATSRLRLAVLQNDTIAAAEQARDSLGTAPVLAEGYVFGACEAGKGLSLADELVDSQPNWRAMANWGLLRGRERWWYGGWPVKEQHLRTRYPPGDAVVPVFAALFLGMREDTIVLRAVERLEAIAIGRVEPAPTSDVRAQAVAWLALWRLGHGELQGVDDARQYLTSQVDRPWRFAGWVHSIDAMRAKVEGADPRTALLRLDSVVRELPLPEEGFPLPAEVQNLLLGRMLVDVGETERALAAIRRRPYWGPFCEQYLSAPEYLREEGRLAATVGDTAGAIQAYNYYLALREDPDPPWRAQWDSVKTELAALVAQ